MQKLLWCLVLLSFTPWLTARAEPPENVRVVLFTVPEKLWQAEMEGKPADTAALWALLDEKARQQSVERTLDVACALQDQTPFEWKRGQKQKFTTSWISDRDKVEVEPKESTQRLVGTRLTVTSEGLMRGDRLGVRLQLEHHTRPPVMQKHNYANAAEGKDRERLSVEYPQFAKLVWEGGAKVGHEWRLLTQMLQPADEKTGAAVAQRHLLFITRIRP